MVGTFLKIVFIISLASLAQAKVSKSAASILALANQLTIEEDRDKALQKLQRFSTVELTEALKQGLEAGGVSTEMAAQAAATLELKSFFSTLFSYAQTHEQWHVFAAMAHLASIQERPRVEAFFLRRLSSFASEQKMLVIDQLAAWKTKLPFADFERLKSDESFEVRMSTVRHFLATREEYETADQIKRMSIVLSLNPYQARLAGWENYARLPAAEQKKLKSALSSVDCKSEEFEEVKAICSKFGAKSK